MRFIKMNGLGNDYIFIDKRKNKIIPKQEEIPLLCDRNFGIGGDGVVIMDRSFGCTLKMTIFNADGSRAELCGNALRCVARYEYDRKRIKNESILTIETDAGVKQLKIDQSHVTADMGEPIVGSEIRYRDTEIFGMNVNVGNPHFVVFCKNTHELNTLFERYAEQISNDIQVFPQKTNVEFVAVHTDTNGAIMRVYERGSQETLACGTGATAVFEAAYQAELLKDNAILSLKGGDLTFTHDEKAHVLLRGDVQYNYTGRI